MNEKPERRGVIGWLRSHPKFCIFLAILLILAFVIFTFDAAAERRVARRLAVSRELGIPLTLEELTARLPVLSDDENMAVQLIAVAEAISQVERDPDAEPLPYLSRVKTPPKGVRYTPEQIEASRAYLETIRSELDKAHQALQLERGCMPVKLSTPLIGTMLPSLSEFRSIAKLLRLEAEVAAHAGNRELVADLLDDLLRFDRSQENDVFLISTLVRIAVQAAASTQIERSINLCGLPDGSLHRLQQELVRIETTPDIIHSLHGESMMFNDTFKWLQKGGGGTNLGAFLGTGATVPVTFWSTMPILPDLDYAEGLRLHNELVAAMEGPTAQTLANVMTVEAGVATMPKYCLVSRVLIPALSRSIIMWMRSVASKRAMIVTIACERYRIAEGQWPADVDALVPVYLERVPVDPFDGEAIRYKVAKDGIIVWSVGENKQDDGGDVSNDSKRSPDFGYRLMNPEMRGREPEVDESAEVGGA